MPSPKFGRTLAHLADDTVRRTNAIRQMASMSGDIHMHGGATPHRPGAGGAGGGACVQLIAAGALLLSLAVAVTVVSIGIARAKPSGAPAVETFLHR